MTSSSRIRSTWKPNSPTSLDGIPFYRRPSGRRLLPMAVALVLVLPSFGAMAHTGPDYLPASEAYWLQWHQPSSPHPVEDWDIEVVPLDSTRPGYIIAAQPIRDADSCWMMQISDYDGPARVRMRAVQDAQRSAWTDYRTVPEPSLSNAVTIGLLLLASGRRQRRPSKS